MWEVGWGGAASSASGRVVNSGLKWCSQVRFSRLSKKLFGQRGHSATAISHWFKLLGYTWFWPGGRVVNSRLKWCSQVRFSRMSKKCLVSEAILGQWLVIDSNFWDILDLFQQLCDQLWIEVVLSGLILKDVKKKVWSARPVISHWFKFLGYTVLDFGIKIISWEWNGMCYNCIGFH
jgi:hypothetical protein